MGVIKFNRDFQSLFNWDTDNNPTTEQDYQNAVKNWTETEKNIVDTVLWQPTTVYSSGNIVKTPSLPSQYVLRCTEAGTSGSTEPSYSGASVGDTVTDGSVEWVIVSLATGNAADVDAGNIGVNAEVDNSEAWASAIGGGAIAEDDVRLVKGDTVYAVTSVMETNIATNTEAIEDNTEAIATNTANIEASAVKIDIDDKRISNIEKLLQGNLYDYQTDTDTKYTKTVLSGAMPYASLDSVGGRAIVFNQLNRMSQSSSTVNDVTFTLDKNALTVTCSGTASAKASKSITAYTSVLGHIYFLKGCPPNGAVDRYWMDVGTSAGEDTGNGFVFTGAYDGTRYIICRIGNGVDATGVVFKPILIDLTLMFGIGNEPTLEQCQQMFPADYYAYNQGQLLSAGVTEVVSKGADTTTIATYSIPAEVQALEGYGLSTDRAYNYIDLERKVLVKNVKKGTVDKSNVANITNTYTNIVYYRYPKPADYLGYGNFGGGRPYDITATKFLMDGASALDTANAIYKIRTSAQSYYVWFGFPLGTTLEEARTYLDGMDFIYPLTTPIEVDISEYITDDNLIETESGGTLTFPNQNGDDYHIPVPSSETYMVDLQSALGE